MSRGAARRLISRLLGSPWRTLALAGLGGALLVAGLFAATEVTIRRATEGRLYPSIAALPEDLGGVAIVPGARVFADGTPSHALADRLQTAYELYKDGRVGKILVSGDHGTGRYDEVNAMHSWLLERGVPPASIYLDHAGFRTLDTMARAARVFEVERAVICTQRFHLGRSVFLARAAGIDALGVEADRRELLRARHNARREALARVRAWLDVHVLGTKPKFLGPPIPISGPASATHDDHTRDGASS